LKNWNTDKIIGAGLIVALILLIVGNMVITLWTGNFPTSDLPMNIVTGLAGYMGRSLLEKQKNDLDSERKD